MKAFLPIILIAFAGCSTITKGTTQAVMISTPGADGATCRLFSPAFGERTLVTPASLVVEKSQHSIQITCSKRCFTNGSGLISSELEVMTAGNLVVGGVIGLGVDAATGAMHHYNPATQIIMAPVQGCRT